MSKPMLFVAVYLEDRAYGGPEEGGWYFSCGEFVRVIATTRDVEKARRLQDRAQRLLDLYPNRGRRPISSVLSEGQYGASIWDVPPPKHFPETTPHYE